MTGCLEPSAFFTTTNDVLKILQGLPMRHDVLVCELLVTYRCGVAALRDRQASNLMLTKVLNSLERSLNKLSDYMDIEAGQCQGTTVERILSTLICCISAANGEILLLLGMLSLFLATHLAIDRQLTPAQSLLDHLQDKLQAEKNVGCSTSLSVLYNKKQCRLVPTPTKASTSLITGEAMTECESIMIVDDVTRCGDGLLTAGAVTRSDNPQTVDAVSVAHLAHVLAAYLSLIRHDLDGCLNHLTASGTDDALLDQVHHIIYLKAFTQLKKGERGEAVLSVNNWRKNHEILSAEMWNLCACLSGQEKPNTAIQMCKEALKLDFDYVLAIYNISEQYRALGLHDAQLEILHLLVTTLQQTESLHADDESTNSATEVSRYDSLCTSGSDIVTCVAANQKLMSLEQALYSLCKRCMELKRYEVAGQKYLDLLAVLTEHNRPCVRPPPYVKLPSLAQIFLECIQCLLHSEQYEEAVSVCQRVIDRSVTTIHQTREQHSQSETSGSEDPGCSRDEVSRGKKRLRSDDDWLTVPLRLQAQMYKADAQIRLSRVEEAHQALDSVITELEEELSQEADNRQLSDDQVKSDDHTSNPVRKKTRINSGGSYVSCSSPVRDSQCRMRCILSEAYSKTSIILLGLQRHQEALTSSRLALTNSNTSTSLVYNHSLILLKVGREQEAYATWLNHRHITTPLDPFQTENLLKRRRASFQCLIEKTDKSDDNVLQDELEDRNLLNMDILALTHLQKNRFYKL